MKIHNFFVLLIIFIGLNTRCQEKEQHKLKVGFVIDFLDADRWYKDKDFFIKAVDSLGAEVIFEQAGGDEVEQRRIIKELILKKIDVLVIVPTNAKGLKDVIDEAHAAGIKVIAYDRLIMDCDLDYYISFDAVDIGLKQAQYAIEQKPHGNYVLFAGPSTDNNALKLREGHDKILKHYIESQSIKVVFDYQAEAWTMMDVYLAFTEFLSANPDTPIDAIIASTDTQAEAAITAFTDLGMENKPLITGQDAALNSCRLILDGQQSMTIYKSIKHLAEEAAKFAVSVAKKDNKIDITTVVNNGFKDVPSKLLEVQIVTKANMNETIIKDGYWSKEQLDVD